MTEMPLKMVPFSKLTAVDEINARGKTKEGIDDLAASIAAKGLIQPLAVRPADNGKFEVIDGRRRYMALAKLVKDGSMKKADGVPVLERNETDSEALETSLLANTQRLPMHEVEQHEVFKRLTDQGMSEADIASRFAISAKTVRQHLALGDLAPAIRKAWKEGKIDADTAKAFTSHDDHAVQAELYERLRKQNGGRFGSFQVRAALADKKQLASECEELTYVGEEAYRAAGGRISESLFDEDNYVEDLPLVRKLARDKLEVEVKRLLGEGWGWAVAQFHYDQQVRPWQCDYIDDDLPEDDDIPYSAEQKAASGVIVELDGNGEVEYFFGLMKKTGASVSSPLPSDDEEDGFEDAGDELDDDDADDASAIDEGAADDELKISASLMRTVSESLTVATAAALERLPETALRAAVAALMSSGHSMPVKMHSSGWPASDALKTTTQFASVFKALEGAPVAELLQRLGTLVAQSLDLRNFNGAPPNNDDAALIAAIDGNSFSLEARKAFNATDYFARASKTVALAAIEEIREAGMAQSLAPEDVLADMKKSELAEAATDAALASGWLPPELRHPAYELGAAKIANAAE